MMLLQGQCYLVQNILRAGKRLFYAMYASLTTIIFWSLLCSLAKLQTRSHFRCACTNFLTQALLVPSLLQFSMPFSASLTKYSLRKRKLSLQSSGSGRFRTQAHRFEEKIKKTIGQFAICICDISERIKGNSECWKEVSDFSKIKLMKESRNCIFSLASGRWHEAVPSIVTYLSGLVRPAGSNTGTSLHQKDFELEHSKTQKAVYGVLNRILSQISRPCSWWYNGCPVYFT